MATGKKRRWPHINSEPPWNKKLHVICGAVMGGTIAVFIGATFLLSAEFAENVLLRPLTLVFCICAILQVSVQVVIWSLLLKRSKKERMAKKNLKMTLLPLMSGDGILSGYELKERGERGGETSGFL